MLRRMSRSTALWSLVILAAAVGPAALAGQPAADEAKGTAITVGTYRPQAVFEKSAGRTELMQLAQSLRQEMTAAQQANDRQKMMQVQQKFQAAQQRITKAFEKKVSDALPAIAEAAGVQVIAQNVAYSTDDVAVKDVTKQVIAAIGEAPAEQKLPMPMPGQKK